MSSSTQNNDRGRERLHLSQRAHQYTRRTGGEMGEESNTGRVNFTYALAGTPLFDPLLRVI